MSLYMVELKLTIACYNDILECISKAYSKVVGKRVSFIPTCVDDSLVPTSTVSIIGISPWSTGGSGLVLAGFSPASTGLIPRWGPVRRRVINSWIIGSGIHVVWWVQLLHCDHLGSCLRSWEQINVQGNGGGQHSTNGVLLLGDSLLGGNNVLAWTLGLDGTQFFEEIFSLYWIIWLRFDKIFGN